jgi:hypothetical protein
MVNLSDTEPKAGQVYFERLAAMAPAERVRVGAALWEAAHSLQWATARRRHPGANEAEIAFQVAVTCFGAELARAAYRRA